MPMNGRDVEAHLSDVYGRMAAEVGRVAQATVLEVRALLALLFLETLHHAVLTGLALNIRKFFQWRCSCALCMKKT